MDFERLERLLLTSTVGVAGFPEPTTTPVWNFVGSAPNFSMASSNDISWPFRTNRKDERADASPAFAIARAFSRDFRPSIPSSTRCFGYA